jgi:hypothetical protein
VLKLLSEDPSNYDDAPTEGIRRIIAEETGMARATAYEFIDEYIHSE